MVINTDIFFDFIGRLKLATVIVGFIDLILIGNSYYAYDSRDEAFLAAVIVCFILSFLWTVGVLLEYFVDMVYHVLACFFLAATDVFFLISVLKYSHNGDSNFVLRLFAMMFGFINSAIYGYLPWKLLKAA